MKQLFGRQLSLPKSCIFIRMNPSPKVLDVDGCFSREKPYHFDSLVLFEAQLGVPFLGNLSFFFASFSSYLSFCFWKTGA